MITDDLVERQADRFTPAPPRCIRQPAEFFDLDGVDVAGIANAAESVRERIPRGMPRGK